MPEEVTYGVWLYGELIGTLTNWQNTTSFSFSESYVQDVRRPVLGLSFEEDLRARFVSNMRLPVWFSNLLPEGVLRDWIAEERGVSVSREIELLAQVGGDLPGAVEVRAETEVSTTERDRTIYGSDESNETASTKWRFSLAGVGLKFSVLRESDRFTCPANGAGGDWIVKLPDKLYNGVPENEYAMMNLAALVGISVPEIRLVHRDDINELPDGVWPTGQEFAFAVKRFDRDHHRNRIHIEDLAQVRGFYPIDKYLGNFETIASYIYRGHDVESLIEFVRRLTLNILIGNGDAHMKNWSLIYADKRRPAISPAYDIVSTGLYVPTGEVHDLGLRFGGSRRFQDVRVRMFDQLATRLGVDADLGDVAAETIVRTRAAWSEIQDLLADVPEVRTAVTSSIEAQQRSLGSARMGK